MPSIENQNNDTEISVLAPPVFDQTVFDQIDQCENVKDGLQLIAGVVAQQQNHLGLNLGSKNSEIPEKSDSQFQHFVDSGQSIKLLHQCLNFQ